MPYTMSDRASNTKLPTLSYSLPFNQHVRRVFNSDSDGGYYLMDLNKDFPSCGLPGLRLVSTPIPSSNPATSNEGFTYPSLGKTNI